MRIITNTALSLDGKISISRDKHFFLGSEEDRRKMSALRAEANAVLVGGTTFRNWPHPLVPDTRHLKDSNPKKPLWNVIVTRSMNVPLTKEFLGDSRIIPLFFTVEGHVPPSFPCEVVQSKKDPSPDFIINELKKRGVKTLLIEAGGNLIFQFLKAHLIDEMFLTLCPKIIGRVDAPSLADGAGFGDKQVCNLELLEAKSIQNEIFLHYRVVK